MVIADDIKTIQNCIWNYYKEFLEEKDIRKYTSKCSELVKKFKDKPDMMSFCQNMIITWAPIINSLAEGFRQDNELLSK